MRKGYEQRDQARHPYPFSHVAQRSLCFRAALGIMAGAQAQAIQTDESSGITLVVPALHALHRGDIRIVERILRFAPASDDVPLV